MENYFRYFKYFNDKSWGLRIITCGYYHGGSGAEYPSEGHPESHDLKWEKGRKLKGCYLVYIPTGRGEFETENSKATILPGDVIKLYPEDWHRYRPDVRVGWEEYWIGFEGPALEDFLLKSLFPEAKSEVSNIGHHDEVIYLFNQSLNITRKNSPGFTQIITGIVFQLVAYIMYPSYQASAGKKADYIYEESVSIIRQHIKDGVDFQKMAANCGLSYSHFRKLFKKKTGFPPQQFLINERLSYAKRLLSSTDLTVEEISEKCGFQSAFYFSNLFKKKTGYAPGKLKYNRN